MGLQGDVALNLYDFVVRQPYRPTEKYGLRAYDEIIIAPMVRNIFRPITTYLRLKCVGGRLYSVFLSHE
jgi:actin-related protein 8